MWQIILGWKWMPNIRWVSGAPLSPITVWLRTPPTSWVTSLSAATDSRGKQILEDHHINNFQTSVNTQNQFLITEENLQAPSRSAVWRNSNLLTEYSFITREKWEPDEQRGAPKKPTWPFCFKTKAKQPNAAAVVVCWQRKPSVTSQGGEVKQSQSQRGWG